MSYINELINAFDYSSFNDVISRVICVLICMAIHETSHEISAYLFTDNRYKNKQLIHWNPFSHMDWLGLAFLFLLGFGWAKPVTVSVKNLRNPKRDFALIALAGPFSNFLLAFASILLGKMLFSFEFVPPVLYSFLIFKLAPMSIGLFIFNLIPIPPLDGSKVLALCLPEKLYYQWLRFERYGFLILVFLSLSEAKQRFISNAIYYLYTFLLNLLL